MKIAKISIKNFLALGDVEMNPSHTNVIVGKNGQGKTSVLKAIKAAFTGKFGADSIRIGETKAEITIELDELVVNRSITEKGTTLKINNKDGFSMNAPQKYLDGILGSFSFNPIEFFDLAAKDRKKYLLSALPLTITKEGLAEYTGEKLDGIDYSKHALEVVADAHKFYYDRRTAANAEVTKKQKSLEELNAKIPAGFDPASFSEARVKMLQDSISDNVRMQDRRAYINREMAQAKNRLDAIEEEKKQILATVESLRQEEDALHQPEAVDEARKELAASETNREAALTSKRAAETRVELDAAVADQSKLDGQVKALADVPSKLLATAKLPIEGLSVEGENITIKGIQLDNLSSAEQLKLGLEVVKALNAEFKVICIDGVEKLDKETFAWFLEHIKDDEYQYFVTRVDGDTPHSFVVDHGTVKQD